MSTQEQSIEDRRQALEDQMVENSMAGHWMPQQERHAPLVPYLWKWSSIYPFLMEAGEVVEIGHADEATARRTVNLVNPAIREYKQTSRTLQMSVQLIKPGERAEAHRHTEALRFVVESTGTYTAVNGERMMMEPNDLVLTPTGGWHDHFNPTNDQAVWLDVLGGHLTRHLSSNYSEMFPEGTSQPITKPDGYSAARYGTMRSRVAEADAYNGVPFIYKWTDTLAALEQLNAAGESDPYDGVLLEYTNPVTGGPTMPIIGCWAQMLRPGEETRAHRHMGIMVSHVIGGEGVTSVGRGADAKSLEWAQRDCFMVPSWEWHSHKNTSSTDPAFIFSVTDRPSIESMGIYRTEEA
jgi:gentisate 1,2-dioxygenase